MCYLVKLSLKLLHPNEGMVSFLNYSSFILPFSPSILYVCLRIQSAKMSVNNWCCVRLSKEVVFHPLPTRTGTQHQNIDPTKPLPLDFSVLAFQFQVGRLIFSWLKVIFFELERDLLSSCLKTTNHNILAETYTKDSHTLRLGCCLEIQYESLLIIFICPDLCRHS